MNYDLTFHVAELLVLAGIAWRVIKSSNRVLDALQDFPLHRHIGNKVIYPSGFAPPPIETIPVDGRIIEEH